MKKSFILYLFLPVLWNACTYESEEKLYPDQFCDTIGVAYQSHIKPIIQNNCLQCHANPAGAGIPKLNDLQVVKSKIDLIINVTSHKEGYVKMPRNAPKLSECQINTFIAWRNANMPEN